MKTSKLSLLLLSAAMFMSVGCKNTKNEPDDHGKSSDNTEQTTGNTTDSIIGRFSVAEGRQVVFSRGNLQYQASTGTWRFPEQQYDYLGADNDKISETNEGWIDLFGFGTSGWDSGAKEYMPYNWESGNENYQPGNSYLIDLTDDYANADWGVYNAISNGGNEKGQWRVLTAAELKYLYDTRHDAAKLRGNATVCGRHGIIFLPDGFVQPEGIKFYPNGKNWDLNKYNNLKWADMERVGAVFLPTAGYRTVRTAAQQEVYGMYWTSTHSDFTHCFAFIFNYGIGYPEGEGDRFLGLSVRLVKDVK